MNPINKIEKKKVPAQRRISKKQKTIAKMQEEGKMKPTLSERRKAKKLTKKKFIEKTKSEHSRNKNTFSKAKRVREKQKKLLQQQRKANSSVLTLMDLWKEMEKSSWTMSTGLLEEELKRRNKTKEKPKKKLKPYVPSAKALGHHQYALKAKEENEAKKAEYQAQQQKKKELRKQKNSLSKNRLVCIQSDNKMMRIRLRDAEKLVKDSGKWKFIAKKYWKKARADEKGTYELYWEESRVDLGKLYTEPNNFERVLKNQKAEAKKQQSKEKVNITATKNRRNRKKSNNKKRKDVKKAITTSNFYKKLKEKSVKLVVANNGMTFIVDGRDETYYRVNTEKLKSLKEKYSTLEDIVKAFKDEKEIGFSFGNTNDTYFLDIINGNDIAEIKVEGIKVEDTENNTFLLDGNSSKCHIFTKKFYQETLKEYKTPANIIKEIEADNTDITVKITSMNFTDDFFIKEHWPKLKPEIK